MQPVSSCSKGNPITSPQHSFNFTGYRYHTEYNISYSSSSSSVFMVMNLSTWPASFNPSPQPGPLDRQLSVYYRNRKHSGSTGRERSASVAPSSGITCQYLFQSRGLLLLLRLCLRLIYLNLHITCDILRPMIIFMNNLWTFILYFYGQF